ncbi:MAG: TonB-dependent receptor [Acidobacteriota bacterium]|nr:TonB-dependent receptor [Acidobacteriota bacterium]
MSRFLSIALMLALTFGGTLSVLAQGQQSGTLTGTVKDSNGDPLPGVTVTVTSPSLLGERTAFTGANGDYIIRGLNPGTYKVVFELSGMTTVERTATVELGRTSRSDAPMQVAEVEETIVVRGEAPTALESTTVGANYDAETIDSLATPRTLFGIAQLAPGLSTNTPNGGQVTISGAFAYDNVFLIDGVDTNDNLFGTSNNLFIEDAIEETQVLTSGVSAEYGRFSGGVINAITKSGGNEFSGSARIDLTNPSWRNETPIEEDNGITRESDQQEVLQATLGGYVVKDALWFFLAGRDQSLASQHVFASTNVPVSRTTDNERYEIKLTGNINSSHTLQGTYTENETSQFRPSFNFTIDPRAAKARTLPNDLFVVRYNGVLTSNLFAELQYSEKAFQFADSGGTSTDIVDSPFLSFGNGLQHYNQPYFDATDPEDRNNEQLAGSVSYFLSSASAGSHDIKVGFEDFTSFRTGGNSQSATSYVFEAEYLQDANGNAILDDQGRLQPIFNGGVILENWIAVRGAQIDIQTQSFYINDKWNFNDHWSFNIGARYEQVDGTATGGVQPVDADAFVPRLAASYDVRGDGKYKFDLTYAEYAGKYSEAQFANNTNVGTPDYIGLFYDGPEGVGLDFAPGFDLNNYVPYNAVFPLQNVFYDEGINSPVVEEITFSAGAEIGRGGYLKLTYTDRSTSDFVEDFINDPLNPVTVVTPIGNQVADRQVFSNTSAPVRDYQGLQLQGRYRITNNWQVEGHWTHQITNDGNFEGEGTNTPGSSSTFGDYPEVFNKDRHFPEGRLNDFQEDRVRLWTTYNLGLGRAGNVGLSLLLNYDSAPTYSLSATRVPLTDQQRAANPGYRGLPTTQTLFFGERGTEEFESSTTVDFAATYSLPIWRSLETWVKFDMRNVFDDDSVIDGFQTVGANFGGPTDADGLPTTFTRPANLGNPQNNEDFVTPREYRISAGIRF